MQTVRDFRNWLEHTKAVENIQRRFDSSKSAPSSPTRKYPDVTISSPEATDMPSQRSHQLEGSHLYILVHGFNSRPEHMTFMAEKIREELGSDAIVHIAVCNRTRGPDFINNPTHDGIDAGGQRLAVEIKEVCKSYEVHRLRYISVIGNSMGGIYARYALGMLYDTCTGRVCGLEPVTFMTTASPHLGLHGFVSKLLERFISNIQVGNYYGGTTAEQIFLDDSDSGGLAPEKFRTPRQISRVLSAKLNEMPRILARRHTLGANPTLARDFRRLPTPRSSAPEVPMERRDCSARGSGPSRGPSREDDDLSGANGVSRNTGEESGGRASSGRLMVAMTTDSPWPFIAALAAFRFRVVYGNTCNDPVVPYETATIGCAPLRDWRSRAPISLEFPHIIHDSNEHVLRWPPDAEANRPAAPAAEVCAEAGEREEDVATMRHNLERLGWRRVSARFLRSVRVGDRQAVLPGVLGAVGVDAHNSLSVVRPLLNGQGRDTVRHVCAVLHEHTRALAVSDVASGLRLEDRPRPLADGPACPTLAQRTAEPLA